MHSASLAQQITAALSIPTVGIGAGVGCDAQVLVISDLLGLSKKPHPRFVRSFAQLEPQIGEAIRDFKAEVARERFRRKSRVIEYEDYFIR